MLGKLFKYEWRTVSKMGLLMLAAIGIVTLLGVIGFALPMSNMETNYAYSDEDSIGVILNTLVAMVTIMVYIVTLMGVVYGMMIYLGVHFYKTMYSDEGYLTMTLPVTPRQLIISKVLNGSIWYGIVCAAMGISVIVLMTAMMFFMGNAMDVSADMQKEMSVFFQELWEAFGIEVVHMIVSVLLMLIITPVSGIMMLFGAITIGQLASKYRALMGVLAYFGISTVSTVVSYIISFILNIGSFAVASATDGIPSMTASYDAAVITYAIMAVVFYFVSLHILSKKLNME